MYHNPACSKSRGAVEILRQRNVTFDLVNYLTHPLERGTLERILDLLPGPAADLVRQDGHFEALGLEEQDLKTREAVVDLLLEHGGLMQRPVVIRGNRAIIGRPPEKVLELLDPA